MSDSPLFAFGRALEGQSCAVDKRAYDWIFRFGDQSSIAVAMPWRIVSGGGIAFADSDDGQKFGLLEPIIGSTKANTLLKDKHVTSVEVDVATADLRIYFDVEMRIDVFNHSSGYEGWQASYPSDHGRTMIIGLGGGELAIFHQPQLVQKS